MHLFLTYFSGISISVAANLLTGTKWNDFTLLRIGSIAAFTFCSFIWFVAAYRSESSLEKAQNAGREAPHTIPESYTTNFTAARGYQFIGFGVLLLIVAVICFVVDAYNQRSTP